MPGERSLPLDTSAIRAAVGKQPVVNEAGEGPAQAPDQRAAAAAVCQAFRTKPGSPRTSPQHMPADLSFCFIDPQCPAVKAHQGHVVQLLRVRSGRVRDPGGFVLPQCDRPVRGYRDIADAVLERGGEPEVAKYVAEANVEPVGEGLEPGVQGSPGSGARRIGKVRTGVMTPWLPCAAAC